jgi:hypothetical protein
MFALELCHRSRLMYYLRSDLCLFVCFVVRNIFFFFFLVGTSVRTDRLMTVCDWTVNWNNWNLSVHPWHSYILTRKITETCLHPWHSCSVRTDGLPYILTKRLTDFIPYGRTDFRTYIALHCIALHYVHVLHCIALCALHCIALRCIALCALHCIALHCILTERNVNSTACLLLNCAIGHV